jgi:hypothetical protein
VRDCRSKPKRETTYTTEEEESLMMVMASLQIRITPQVGTVQAATAATLEGEDVGVGGAVAHIVHLREERVFTQLGEREEHDCKSWICNTGATNQMSGSRAAFIELDMTMRGTVRFGDDSMTEIEGRGVVEFLFKNGERRSFTGVYFIPRLMVNIVSVGQLDEAGYDIHIKAGKMDIRESGGRAPASQDREETESSLHARR